MAIAIDDSYSDFVSFISNASESEEVSEQVYEYMKNNKTASTSDVIKFFLNITGNTEPLEIVDD